MWITIPISEAGKWCKHLALPLRREWDQTGPGTSLVLHQVGPTWGCALSATLSSQLMSQCATPEVLLSWACSLLQILGSSGCSMCTQSTVAVPARLLKAAQPASCCCSFILTWQVKSSSSFLSWNGCAAAESRMGPAVLYINLSLPGNANGWLPAVWTPAAGWNTVLPTPTHSPRCAKKHSVSANITGFFFFWMTPVTPDTKGQMGYFRGLWQNKDNTKL